MNVKEFARKLLVMAPGSYIKGEPFWTFMRICYWQPWDPVSSDELNLECVVPEGEKARRVGGSNKTTYCMLLMNDCVSLILPLFKSREEIEKFRPLVENYPTANKFVYNPIYFERDRLIPQCCKFEVRGLTLTHLRRLMSIMNDQLKYYGHLACKPAIVRQADPSFYLRFSVMNPDEVLKEAEGSD